MNSCSLPKLRQLGKSSSTTNLSDVRGCAVLDTLSEDDQQAVLLHLKNKMFWTVTVMLTPELNVTRKTLACAAEKLCM